MTTRTRGRPLKYDEDTRLAILQTYEETPVGERNALAVDLGITFSSLMVYISKWRKDLSARASVTEMEANDKVAVSDS